MSLRIYYVFFWGFGITGLAVGYKIGEHIGIAALPPNAWAGDGLGVELDADTGAFWGIVIGLVLASACSLVWFLRMRRHRRLNDLPEQTVAEEGVWPPPPKRV